MLRPWTAADVPRMCELFDDPAIDRWTPTESPYTGGAARRHLDRAGRAALDGSGLHLAVTTDGGPAHGEVLLFGREGDGGEIGYMIGAAARRRGLAAAAVETLVAHARDVLGLRRLVLRIEPGNAASEAVARSCGFARRPGPVEVQVSKGRRVELATWELTSP